MRNQGFTLIEVIVAMAIVAIMAGALVPLSYRIWESQEVDTTSNRMEALKAAMVGDIKLYQQGTHTDFGYVGDNGELPASLTELTPYLNTGFNPTSYNQDAWGEGLIYTTAVEAATGRYQSATLVSTGPDRTLSTADDLEIQIVSDEVIPTVGVMSNLSYSVTNQYNAAVFPVYSARVTAYQALEGLPFEAAGCVLVNVGRLEAESYSGLTSVFYDSDFPNPLPVGKFIISGELYKNGTCNGASAAETNDVVLFVNRGLRKLYVNLRFPPLIN